MLGGKAEFRVFLTIVKLTAGAADDAGARRLS
jgi:hypothetical protein